MSFTPIYKGSTPLLHNTFKYDSGALFPLSGLDVTKFTMYLTQNGATRLGTGTFSNLDTAASTIDYQMSTGDTGTAGVWDVFPVVDLGNDKRPFDPQHIYIEDLHLP